MDNFWSRRVESVEQSLFLNLHEQHYALNVGRVIRQMWEAEWRLKEGEWWQLKGGGSPSLCPHVGAAGRRTRLTLNSEVLLWRKKG